MQLDDPNYVAEQLNVYYENRTGPFTDNRGLALAMIPLRNMTDEYESIVVEALAQDPAAYLLPDVDETVLEGFKAVSTLAPLPSLCPPLTDNDPSNATS